MEKVDLLERSIRNLLKRREGIIEQYGLNHPLVTSINQKLGHKKKRLEIARLRPQQGRLF